MEVRARILDHINQADFYLREGRPETAQSHAQLAIALGIAMLVEYHQPVFSVGPDEFIKPVKGVKDES